MKVIKWWVFFLIGFYLSAVFMVLPLVDGFQWFRPQWVLMFFIYCQLLYPKHFNPLIAWLGGVLVDALLGMPLGANAIVYAMVCFIASFLKRHFTKRPLWQQIGKIALLICLSQILILWFHALSGKNPHTLLYWMSTVTSCLIWPVFVKILQVIEYPFRLSHHAPRSI